MWPIPFALGVVTGALASTGGSPLEAWMALLAALLLALGAIVGLVSPRAPSAVVALAIPALLLALGCGLGLGRGLQSLAVPDPWASEIGSDVVVHGRSDGALLHVPGRGALVLRGVPVPDGRVEVGGRLEALVERRNPGGFDARAHWRRRGAWAGLRVHEVLVEPAAASPREALRRGVVAGLSPAAGGLVQAMTLGIRDDLDDLRALFAASGLAHVLALSGLHVGVLAGALGLALRPLGRRAAPLVVLAVALYVLLVGPSPSVVRAALMVVTVATALGLRVGRPALGASLALACAGSLLVSPLWSRDLGFALSYLSVAGILVVTPLLASLWRQRSGRAVAIARAVVGSLAVSAAAQLATASLVASHFGALPLLSPLVNVVAVPLASLLVPTGFLAAVAGLLGEAPARVVNLVTSPLAETLIRLARAASRGPVLPWGEIATGGHVLYAVAVIAVAAALRRILEPWRAALVVVVAIAVSLAVPPPHAVPELVALDVGQGDAVVLRLGGGQAILVDGGGRVGGSGVDMGARVVVPALRALGIVALPVVVSTHADLDHIHGLLAVLATLPVGELWIGHREDERPLFSELLATAARRGVAVREVRRGESVRFGRVRLEVVHPIETSWGEPNDDSVAIVVHVDEVPWALLAGDVTARVERDLPVPPLQVLMTPHHGSATSTSDDLLDATRPRLAIISVGSNRYGHPAAVVLERLTARGVEVRSTRAEGAIRLAPPGAPPGAPRRGLVRSPPPRRRARRGPTRWAAAASEGARSRAR
jgi:competence protein ComEC